MSMRTLGIIVVFIIIIVAGGYYFISKAPAPSGASTATSTSSNSSQSLSALVAAGQPVTCTFSTTTSAGVEQGTIYVNNGSVAGDFTMTQQRSTQPIRAHMIVRSGTSYVWTSMSNQGFKSSVNATSTSGNQGVGYSMPMNYSCSPWTPDQAKFNLPANVSFTATESYQAPAQGAGATGASGGAQGSASECAACNGLPSAQKAQCLAALNCQ